LISSSNHRHLSAWYGSEARHVRSVWSEATRRWDEHQQYISSEAAKLLAWQTIDVWKMQEFRESLEVLRAAFPCVSPLLFSFRLTNVCTYAGNSPILPCAAGKNACGRPLYVSCIQANGWMQIHLAEGPLHSQHQLPAETTGAFQNENDAINLYSSPFFVLTLDLFLQRVPPHACNGDNVDGCLQVSGEHSSHSPAQI
jgi:hypothetical protein